MSDNIFNHKNFHMEVFSVDYDNPKEVKKFLKRFELTENYLEQLKKIQDDVFIFLCWYTKNGSAGVDQLIRFLLKEINLYVRDEMVFLNGEIKIQYNQRGLRPYCLSLIKNNIMNNNKMRICKECGNYFVLEHESQEFCTKLPGNTRSTCENTYNKRIRRIKKNDEITV